MPDSAQMERNTVAYADNFTNNSAASFLFGRVAPFLRRPDAVNRQAEAPRLPPDTVSRTLARHTPTDVRLPCMVYAAIGALPRDAGPEAEQAIAAMRKAPGVLNVISYGAAISFAEPLVHETGIAVIARGYWLARQSLARLLAQCAAPGAAAPLPGPGAEGCVARGTAQFLDGRLRVWHATADAVRSRSIASRIAGIAEDSIDLRVVGDQESAAGLRVLVAAISLAHELQPAPVQVIVTVDDAAQSPAVADPAVASVRSDRAGPGASVALAA
jgi:hypothetical protein